jgi:hypothetical protein
LDIPHDILKYIIEQYLIDLGKKHPEEFFRDAIVLSKTNKHFNGLVKEVIIEIVKKATYVNIKDFVIAAQGQEKAAYDNIKDSAIKLNSNNIDPLFNLKFWKKIELEDKYKNKNIIADARNFVIKTDLQGIIYDGKSAELKSILSEILKEKNLDESTVKWLIKINQFFKATIFEILESQDNGKFQNLVKERNLRNNCGPIILSRAIIIYVCIIGLAIIIRGIG